MVNYFFKNKTYLNYDVKTKIKVFKNKFKGKQI